MSNKENDEFSSLTSELKNVIIKEAKLLSKIYEWFHDIAITNNGAATKISPQDLQKIGELTSVEAEDIESRTDSSGLSSLVSDYISVQHKIIESKKRLSKLWSKIIKNLTK